MEMYIIFESIYVLQMKSRKVGGLSEQANEAGGGQGGGAQTGRGGEVTPASTVTDLKEKAYQGKYSSTNFLSHLIIMLIHINMLRFDYSIL